MPKDLLLRGVHFVKKNKKPAPSQYAPKVQSVEYPKFARSGSVAKTKINPVINNTTVREDGLSFKALPSKVTPGGSTAKKEDSKYTGHEMIGVSIMHKSCLQPLFTHEHAKAAATMRR